LRIELAVICRRFTHPTAVLVTGYVVL
jgi:hypothetical protein